MPSHPLTIILNSNHTKRVTILVDNDSIESILCTARNKFRQKALCRVFLPGGIDVEDVQSLPPTVKEVFVSKGEAYTGPLPRDVTSIVNSPTEVRVIADRSFVDDKALTQLQAVSQLVGVRAAVGMPDLHPGNRFPIGCAIAVEGIYPALIGSDVGCGIALYALGPPAKSHPSPSKLAHLLRGLDTPWDGDVHEWLRDRGIQRHSEFDKSSLGTVGAGNHFAEISVVEEIVDGVASAELAIQEDALYLIVHTGSRGLGAMILADRTATQSNPYIDPASPLIEKYLADHDYAVQWAIANRDLVAHRIKGCLYPHADDDSELKKLIDVTHNSVSRTPMSLNPGEDVKELWIHRKGAAPADKGVVPCPGSRGDFSWLLSPLGDGQYNAQSLAHGAGRLKARQSLHLFAPARQSLTTTSLGSEVVCTDPDLLLEERPEAYKSVEGVVHDMVDKGMCNRIARLRPLVSYKVREGGERSRRG